MKPSPDVKEAMLRLYAARAAGDVNGFLGVFSDGDGVLAVGSDPDEWWPGSDKIAAVYRAQLQEMGGKVEIRTGGDLQAFAEGTVGWAADRVVMYALGVELPMRITAVFHQEDGAWKMVLHHASVAVSNAQVLGKELTTRVERGDV